MFFPVKYFKINLLLKKGQEIGTEIRSAKTSTDRRMYENGNMMVFTGERGRIEKKEYNEYFLKLEKKLVEWTKENKKVLSNELLLEGEKLSELKFPGAPHRALMDAISEWIKLLSQEKQKGISNTDLVISIVTFVTSILAIFIAA